MVPATRARLLLAPNSPLRAAVTALATPAHAAPVLGASISTGECAPGVVPMSSALPSQSEPVLPKRAAHYLWAVLIARIYEVFPLKWPTAAAPTCRRSASNGLAPHAKWPSGLAHHARCRAASGVFLFRLAWPCASERVHVLSAVAAGGWGLVGTPALSSCIPHPHRQTQAGWPGAG